MYIPLHYHTQEPRGFAFIEYANIALATEAREEMDRFPIQGQELEVVFAQEQRKSPHEMRKRGGPPQQQQQHASGSKEETSSKHNDKNQDTREVKQEEEFNQEFKN